MPSRTDCRVPFDLLVIRGGQKSHPHFHRTGNPNSPDKYYPMELRSECPLSAVYHRRDGTETLCKTPSREGISWQLSAPGCSFDYFQRELPLPVLQRIHSNRGETATPQTISGLTEAHDPLSFRP